MFTIEGLIYGKQQKISYFHENGKGRFEGDTPAINFVSDALRSNQLTGPVGQYIKRDINSPLAVLFVIKECFETITAYEGEIPEATLMPDGAI